MKKLYTKKENYIEAVQYKGEFDYVDGFDFIEPSGKLVKTMTLEETKTQGYPRTARKAFIFINSNGFQGRMQVDIGDYIVYEKNSKTVMKKDEFERITYAVEEELKYNLSIEEVKGLAYNNIISLDKDNILKLLTIEGLEMIQKGNDIVIVVEDMDKDRIKINICLSEECYGNTVESKRSFVKDRTMNEYYE